MKLAMDEVESLLEDVEWAQMILTVHDELIFECEDARVDALIERVGPAMEGAVKLSVPLVVDSGRGKTWAAAKA
jgi:DNA polymerase-1